MKGKTVNAFGFAKLISYIEKTLFLLATFDFCLTICARICG